MPLLLQKDFLVKEIANYLIFYIANEALLIYRMISRIVGFSELILDFEAIGISRCLGARAVFRAAYNTCIL